MQQSIVELFRIIVSEMETCGAIVRIIKKKMVSHIIVWNNTLLLVGEHPLKVILLLDVLCFSDPFNQIIDAC